MSGEQVKKDAFSVLRAASKRAAVPDQKAATPDRQPRAKRQRQDSNFAACPICGRLQPRALLPGHASACLEGGDKCALPTGVAALSAAVTEISAQTLSNSRSVTGMPSSHNIPSTSSRIQQDLAGKQLASPLTGSSASVELKGAAPGASSEQVRVDAFARLMQHQRNQSNVHNFYLEMRSDGTWLWHWFITNPRTDAKLVSELESPGRPLRDEESSKRRMNGGSSHKYVPSQQMPLREVEPSATAASLRVSDAEARTERWHSLPPATWHAMTQLSGCKLGGSPHVKAAVRLLTNVPPGERGSEVGWKSPGLVSNVMPPGGAVFRGSISVLKSALQKNIRLCRPESAVRCALHLIKEDVTEFLRRCPIICLEDSILHPALPLLVWLMAAHSKGYTLGRSQISSCLRIVHHLADSPLRDAIPEAPSKTGPSSLELFESVKGVQDEAESLVRCILMRAAFGGMAGDVEMLKGFAELWASRLAGLGGQPPQDDGVASTDAGQAWLALIWSSASKSQAALDDPDALYKVSRVGPMLREDIPPSAIDFHVSSIVEELLQNPEIASEAQMHPGDPAQRLRKAVWLFRSSLNHKDPVVERAVDASRAEERKSLQGLWAVASPHVETWSLKFIASKFY